MITSPKTKKTASQKEELRPISLTTIECGIGKIEYKANNLQLEMVMEALSSAISKRGAAAVIDLLS